MLYNKMKVLELFCGTKSFGKFANELGWDVVSLDIDKKYKPDICSDICCWDYKQFSPKDFDIIWASPEFKNYDVAPIKKTLELLDYFKPEYWFIENPETRKMKDHIPKYFPYVDIDYCRFGYPYRKRTRIWHNREIDDCLCQGVGVCKSMEGGRHVPSSDKNDKTSHILRYQVPTDLFYYLIFS